MDDGPIRAAVEKQIGAIGSLNAAVDAIGGLANRSQLSRYGTGGEERVPVVVAMALDLATGRPDILAAAARKLGYRLVPLDAEEAARDALVASSDAVLRAARLAHTVVETAPDGFTPFERQRIRGDITDVTSALHALETAIGGEK